MNLRIFLNEKIPAHKYRLREKIRMTLEAFFRNGQMITNAQRLNKKTRL